VPEVSEAMAVNIFPHNNHSLLVVEQAMKQIPPDAKDEIPPMPSAADNPVLTFQPSTPPSKSTEFNVDSPLKNPREAPLPPTINILPATPLDDEKDPMDRSKPSSPPRRPSLLQKAKRYSDSYIQPMFTKTPTIRRKASLRGHHNRHKRHEEGDGRLHPNWRPRDYMDSNSDSEPDFGDEEEDAGSLPPGGDTSEPPLPRRLTRKLPGFRGTGGFMIGNSLGVERHGTNIRRHHITVPPQFKGRWKKGSPASDDRVQQRPLYPQNGNAGDSPASSLPRPPYASPTPTSSAGRTYQNNSSLSSLRGMNAQQQQNLRRTWKALGLRIEYVGMQGVRDLWRDKRNGRREKRAEKRRDELRKSIGQHSLLRAPDERS